MARIRERIDFQQVANQALANSIAVLGRLLPDGRREGAEWTALNPRRADSNLGSFRVNIRTGKWADFAIDVRGGDLISLAAYIDDVNQLEAARRLAVMLGETA